MLVVLFGFFAAMTSRALAEGGEEPSEPRVVTLKQLDLRGPWLIDDFSIDGVDLFSSWSLAADLQTETKPWWKFWADDPLFVPGYLTSDLEVIRRRLQADGYYEATVKDEITVLKEPGVVAADGTRTAGVVSVAVHIERGPPVVVCSLFLERGDAVMPSEQMNELERKFPVHVGDRFTEADYAEGAEHYTNYLLAHGFPEAKVDRRARVAVETRCAEVAYGLLPGRPGAFGATQIDGLTALPNEIVEREITYRQGEKFDGAKVAVTADRLRATRLFSLVRVEKEPMNAAGEVPIKVTVAEGPEHEIRLGVGYGTEDGIRGVASWWDYNFLGGNRRLGFTAKGSQINRYLNASFVQPHFPRLDDQTSLSFTLGQQDESTYLDNAFITTPSIAWKLGERASLTTFMSFAYDSLSGVTEQTVEALGPPDQFQVAGFTNLAGVGFRWLGFDNVANPRRGLGIGVSAAVAGGPLGADFSYFSLIAQASYYHPVVGDLVWSVGGRAGSIVPYDGTPQIPLWARLYAGGASAFPVRGYARRRVGPLSGSNDPIGGRSAIVGTTELLYPIFGPVVGVLFFDAGDVELSAWTFNPSNVQKGVGVGARAVTPVGPVEIDFGFGLDHPAGDSVFQVLFTIGPTF